MAALDLLCVVLQVMSAVAADGKIPFYTGKPSNKNKLRFRDPLERERDSLLSDSVGRKETRKRIKK